jgi:xylulokinase
VFWRGLLAGILNKRVVTLETQEGSAYGAALLALAGQYGSVPEMCKVAIKETESVRPDAGAAAFYGKAHKVYQSIYPALKPICVEIAGL